jgi:hypothetical protein
MRRLWTVGIVALAGCGAKHPGPPDARCAEPAVIMRVAAGGAGPRISDCVHRSTSDSELQNVGFAVTRAADQLGRGTDGRGLGFLIGAVRRGTGTSGVQAELVHRVEGVARRMHGQDSAIQQGIADGEARG